MTTEINELLDEVRDAFNKSSIKEHGWFYSLSATALTKNANVLVGFNWGTGSDKSFHAQKEIPKENFGELYKNKKKELGSFQRVYKPLKKYLSIAEVDECIQTNYCFFRSPSENNIKECDLKLCQPIFRKFINIVKPKRIIAFSKPLYDWLLKERLLCSIEPKPIKSNNRTLFAAKGFYKVDNDKVPTFFLPHPNAPFTTDARKKAWEFCFPVPASSSLATM